MGRSPWGRGYRIEQILSGDETDKPQYCVQDATVFLYDVSATKSMPDFQATLGDKKWASLAVLS
jgi:hypothetical protein